MESKRNTYPNAVTWQPEDDKPRYILKLVEVQEMNAVYPMIPIGWSIVRDGGGGEEMPWSLLTGRGEVVSRGTSPARTVCSALFRLAIIDRRRLARLASSEVQP